MKAFKDWEENAVASEAVEFGYLSRHQRCKYQMLGQSICEETYFPHNVFKSIEVYFKAWDFNICETDPIMLLAKKHGATWQQGYYAEEGYGWPVFSGESGAEKCWNFLTEYNSLKINPN